MSLKRDRFRSRLDRQVSHEPHWAKPHWFDRRIIEAKHPIVTPSEFFSYCNFPRLVDRNVPCGVVID